MTKSLVIVESPAKAKTISKYLGSDYIVQSSVGHIRDLPKKIINPGKYIMPKISIKLCLNGIISPFHKPRWLSIPKVIIEAIYNIKNLLINIFFVQVQLIHDA